MIGTGMDTAEFSRKLTADAEQMRFVTHNDVSREDCGRVLQVVKAICRK
ncbi:MAG TPA: hypothetical protein VGH51_09940 [Candidatus Angelobacter sp.]